MPWPPTPLPINFQNATQSLDTHPNSHNQTNVTINNDIVPKLQAVADNQVYYHAENQTPTTIIPALTAIELVALDIPSAPIGVYWIDAGFDVGVTVSEPDSEIFFGVAYATGGPPTTIVRTRVFNSTTSLKAMPSMRAAKLVTHTGGPIQLSCYVYLQNGTGQTGPTSPSEQAWIIARRLS